MKAKDELSRGDVLKSVECSMHANGTREEVARVQARNLISDAWKKINKDAVVESPFPRDFVYGALGLARMYITFTTAGTDGFG
ncbi:hypothetical protein H6P81_014881 [Aristolochia fimbriata]|uniref:Terpene synthase metal-binding domain-containing protein n=1 Tax=Aristolochia fimbriata TaxID=158543 RepID=A0AAV7E5A5_ARIFI|nr:hypothetical protein H6P81_014881 [Aristolochia fimbriata]